MQMNKYHQSGCERKRFWLNRATALAAASEPPQTLVSESSCAAATLGRIGHQFGVCENSEQGDRCV